MMAQNPIKTKSGTVWITDSSVFPVSLTIAAALVEVDPGGMRELHWHPNVERWRCHIVERRTREFCVPNIFKRPRLPRATCS
jgi:oxalate decarboxylase/phosphoglucose isomerase-like protein (cupin superfamily)